MKKYLLVISCSANKDTREGLIPAIKRYTGAWYGVINKLGREKKLPENLAIVIISAKYGLLKSNDLIEYYDLRMTKERAKSLNPSILNGLKFILSGETYEQVFVNMGKDYMPAIRGLESIDPKNAKLYYAKGRVGEKKKQMKNWILSLTNYNNLP